MALELSEREVRAPGAMVEKETGTTEKYRSKPGRKSLGCRAVAGSLLCLAVKNQEFRGFTILLQIR
jgi:hypothetical protein